MIDYLISDISMEYVPSFREALDIICKERKYLAFTEAPPIAIMQNFAKNIIENGHIQKIALHKNTVIGWCDILINDNPGFSHSGRLGMGIIPEFRGKKIGTALLDAALEEAKKIGLKKIELEVFLSNSKAISLYLKYGFVIEGKKVKARYLDSEYDDVILMALFLEH